VAILLLALPHVASYTYIKARSGKASIMNFRELPDGIAGVILLFFVRFGKSVM
jgi:hypothetical protein